MTTAESIFEEARTSPECDLLEVLDFVGYLKARARQPMVNEADVAAQTDWEEFEQGAGLWSGKFVREACYDRKSLR